MSIKLLLLGGGCLGEGGSADFIFMGARIFLRFVISKNVGDKILVC